MRRSGQFVRSGVDARRTGATQVTHRDVRALRAPRTTLTQWEFQPGRTQREGARCCQAGHCTRVAHFESEGGMKCSKCDGKVVAKGLCMTHYQAERRTMLKPVRVEATERTLMAALLVGGRHR